MARKRIFENFAEIPGDEVEADVHCLIEDLSPDQVMIILLAKYLMEVKVFEWLVLTKISNQSCPLYSLVTLLLNLRNVR